MNDIVSVIIPVFNVVKYLQKSVDSILNQTFENLQVILVDDGSTDGSSILADQLAKQDSRVEVIHQSNQGLSIARNTGLDHALGEFAFFFDSDDLVESRLIEDAISFLNENEADFVSFTHDFIDEKGSIYHKYIDNSEYEYSKIVSREKLISNILVNKVRISAWSYIFRIKVFQQDTPFFRPGVKYEDNDSTINIVLLSKKSGLLSNLPKGPYYHYRQRKNSITSGLKMSNYNDLLLVTRIVKKKIVENTKIVDELNIYCLNQLFSAYRILRVLNDSNNEIIEVNDLIKKNISIKIIINDKKTFMKYCYWKFWSTFDYIKIDRKNSSR